MERKYMKMQQGTARLCEGRSVEKRRRIKPCPCRLFIYSANGSPQFIGFSQRALSLYVAHIHCAPGFYHSAIGPVEMIEQCIVIVDYRLPVLRALLNGGHEQNRPLAGIIVIVEFRHREKPLESRLGQPPNESSVIIE